MYLLKFVDRLRTKLDAEEKHGSEEKAEYLRRIISETEEKINDMQSDG